MPKTETVRRPGAGPGPGPVGPGGNYPPLTGQSDSGFGVRGLSDTGDGVLGYSASGVGVHGSSEKAEGVLGEGATGVHGKSSGGGGLNAGVFGEGGTAVGVYATSEKSHGVFGFSKAVAPYAGVWGQNDNSGHGVHGIAGEGNFANPPKGTGVWGESWTGIGVYGASNSGDPGCAAVVAENKTVGPGLHAISNGGSAAIIDGLLQVNGDHLAHGTIYVDLDVFLNSDATLKTDIEPIPDALDKVLSLDGVYFKWKESSSQIPESSSGTREVGLLAQQVAEIVPEVVSRRTPHRDHLAINYNKLVALLIEAIKQQQQQVRNEKLDLQNQIDELRRTINNTPR